MAKSCLHGLADGTAKTPVVHFCVSQKTSRGAFSGVATAGSTLKLPRLSFLTVLPKLPSCIFASRKRPAGERFRVLPLRAAPSNYPVCLFYDPSKIHRRYFWQCRPIKRYYQKSSNGRKYSIDSRMRSLITSFINYICRLRR